MTHYFGAHTIDNGGIYMAARRAGAASVRVVARPDHRCEDRSGGEDEKD